MKLEELFSTLDEDEENEELKEILSHLYDEEKIDFNTELTASQVWAFTEMETISKNKEKWDWVQDFIHTYERKVISKNREGRKEITGLHSSQRLFSGEE
jgi:hypothetical protein